MLRFLFLFVVVGAAGAAGLFGAGPVIDALTQSDAATRPSGPSPAGAGGGERRVRVVLARAETRSVEESIQAVGTTRAARSVDIEPASAGRITALPFEAGSRLAEGDVIVALDSRAEEASLKQAQAAQTQARDALQRAENLAGRNVTSEASLLTARADLLSAEASVEMAENTLDDRTVRAPFAGTTGISDLDAGQRIDAGTVVTTLDDLSAVDVSFSLPERYFSRIERDQAVRATTSAFPDRTFEGRIRQIGTRIDAENRAFRVEARIDNGDRALAAGLFMDVTVALSSRKTVTVPEESVVQRGEGSYVFVAENGSVRRVPVTTGQRLGDVIAVTDGLEAGSRVVVSGLQNLSDGDAIAEVEADEPEAASLG